MSAPTAKQVAANWKRIMAENTRRADPLERAKDAYVSGAITLRAFEARVARVLHRLDGCA